MYIKIEFILICDKSLLHNIMVSKISLDKTILTNHDKISKFFIEK